MAIANGREDGWRGVRGRCVGIGEGPGERLGARYGSGIKIKGGGAQRFSGRNKMISRSVPERRGLKYSKARTRIRAFITRVFSPPLSHSLSLQGTSLGSRIHRLSACRIARSPYRGSRDTVMATCKPGEREHPDFQNSSACKLR